MILLLLLTLAVQRAQISTDALEARIFDLVNLERSERKLRPLQLNTRLTELARAHSHDMAKRGFFDHVNPDGKSPLQRGQSMGIPCRRQIDAERYSLGVAENIFQNNLYDRVVFRNDKPTFEWKAFEDIAKSTVNGWMDSPGHRQVILTARYLTAGVGVAIAPNDQVLITQEFC